MKVTFIEPSVHVHSYVVPGPRVGLVGRHRVERLAPRTALRLHCFAPRGLRLVAAVHVAESAAGQVMGVPLADSTYQMPPSAWPFAVPGPESPENV